jgi:hypothetical protein
LASAEIASLRDAIQKAEASPGQRKKLKAFASSLEKDAGQAKDAADAARLTALAEIMKRPEA